MPDRPRRDVQTEKDNACCAIGAAVVRDGRPPVRTNAYASNIFADAECGAACSSDREGKAYEKNVALRESQVPAGFTCPDKERGADQLGSVFQGGCRRAWFGEHGPGLVVSFQEVVHLV